MNAQEKTNLIKNIESFENCMDELSPQDAELMLVAILTPLLGSEGYDVNYQGGIGDQGIDLLASKGETKVGIEYKHFKAKLGGDAIRNLVGAAVLNSFDKMILISKSGFSEHAKRLANVVDPISVELIDIDGLKHWTSKIEANYDESEVIHVIRSCTQKIIELITRSTKALSELEWRDLERVIAEVFSGIGFDVELTPSSKDGGKDVILECISKGTKKTFIIEIKHWRSGQKVGEKKVREFVKVLATQSSFVFSCRKVG
ncbi:MAG: restriction endonuclease [Pedobacter sp.]